ncbi:pre-rRNA processing protein-like protein Utp22 [Lindgomyces ingoldianus]|uniref:Pre-rRNA processing protein-like protein Utp22 n=1 Tax=Lindgomyces ingoldianus TaxID=673940 RepID=A0ACB6QIK5_9PLEO|nr:pre-rRNA processing protein-like protein Utp22 [Lindgomyces ingoldianus]KAF2466725.1 pre-rRNA processing protein-like protein Utp22 [Lindgomyces ingoldianus]
MLQDGAYTAEVYKSNLFKLQVDELLQQLKPKYGKKEAPAEKAMWTLKTIIEQIPSRAPLSIPDSETALESEKIVIPFPNPRPPRDAKYKMQYDRPTSINAIGSYPLKTTTRAEDELAIDLAVTMPKSLFQEKDYLNHRYFYKRAFYLACLAAGIRGSKEHKFNASFELLNGNQLQPIIVIRPIRDGNADDFSASKCRIHILPALPDKMFLESKLRPDSNCIRPKDSNDKPESMRPKPTPFYNATVQSDASISPYLKFLHYSSSKCNAYKDACILGRTWLRQRGFGGSARNGGFGNFEWGTIIAILLQANLGDGVPPLSSGYSSYQLFKATLQFLATRDLIKAPYAFNSCYNSSDFSVSTAESTPIFFDGPRNINILFKMSPWSYERLRSEAELTVDMLGDSVFDQFDSTFILKANAPNYRYDTTLEVPLAAFGFDSMSETHDQDILQACRNMYFILARALTNRVTTISFHMPNQGSWPVTSRRPPEDQKRRILITFATNPSYANRTVDYGPTAENKKDAASFRQFWGEKAELRRFKDGSILESVVWSYKHNSTPVIQQIILFIIGKHFSAKLAGEAVFTTDRLGHLIPSGRIVGKSGIEPFSPLMTAFATLDKDIRGLEGFPLQIRHIIAADPQLRYSTVEFPTYASKTFPHTPASVVVQFEGSARWPDDLAAIQRTKIAFLLKVADLLSSSKSTYVTRVGLENPSQPSLNQAYLEIILPSSLSFRLRIHHDREATLLDRQLKDKSLDGFSRESSALALAVYKREFQHLPAHTQAMQSMCTRFPALSPSIRLTKRWFDSHLLSPHFSPVLIELLVVRTFLQPYPWPVPSCATTGFLRTLAWISRWDWRHNPLVIDFSTFLPAKGSTDLTGGNTKGLKAEDLDKIHLSFEAWRRIDPSMNRVVLFAASNIDPQGTTWTDRGMPEKVVAARLTSLARSATGLVREDDDRLMSRLAGEENRDILSNYFTAEALFIPQLKDYDVVIHISSDLSRAGEKRKESKFKNLQIQLESQELGDSQKIGYDPVELFARELQEVYGEALLWFWDPEALDVIAGLWNPSATAQRGFKVKSGWNSLPVNTYKQGQKNNQGETSHQVEIQINKGAILNEIGKLGGEIINTIEVR